MSSFLYKIALVALVLACSSCGDDDSDLPATDRPDGSMDASMDASMNASEASDDRDGGDGDGGVQPDGAVDRDSSVDPDAGDAAVCELVDEPWLADPETPFRATRVPLAALCGEDGCPSLAAFADDYACTQLDADASIADFDFEDAGVVVSCCFNWWIRTEGCGQVQYRSYQTWPRLYNFDADTGALIGRALLDDVGSEIAGCTNAAFVGGTLLHDCPTATESVCDWLE